MMYSWLMDRRIDAGRVGKMDGWIGDEWIHVAKWMND